jgi:hypothetical protein
MVGLASALIGINTAAFKQVFGVAIEAAQQMRMAVEQLVGGLAAVAGMALTGSPAPMLGMVRPSDGNSRTGQDSGLLTSTTADDAGGTAGAAGGFASSSQGSASNASSAAAQSEKDVAPSPNRVAYRLGNASASSQSADAAQQEHPAKKQTDTHDRAGNESETGRQQAMQADTADSAARAPAPRPKSASNNGAIQPALSDIDKSDMRDKHADARSTVSQAGSVVRAVSRATRMSGFAGAALRGFGEGAGAGDLVQRQTTTDTAGFSHATASDDLMQARGERFARYTLGVDSPDDAHFIAAQLTSPPGGTSVEQMRQAYESVAPIARDMARQYGSPARAAAQGGYGSYGEMATALATERLHAQGGAVVESTAGLGAVPGPVEAWTTTSPGQSQGITPYDYGVGAMVSGRLGAHPATAPEWARTAQSLRQAYGDHAAQDAMLNRFVNQVESGQFSNEREAMQWLETELQQQPATNGQQVDLWWRGNNSNPVNHASAGAPHYDAGQSQAERFARFTLGADTPGDIHAIAEQLSNSQGGQGSYSPAQMRESYEAIAPLARDMSRQYGSPTRAAAIGGYDSYGQLVTAMAEEHLRIHGVLPQDAQAQSPASAGPIETWSATPPGQGATSQNITPYDYGMGGFVAGQLGASAGARPEWVRTMFSLRQAYGDHSIGETVFTDFIQRVGSKQFENERDARAWLEQQIETRVPTSGRNVHLWWRASASAGDAPAAKSSRARKTQEGED